MNKVLNKALALWNWIWKDYDPKETSWMLFGGALVKAIDGNFLAAVGLTLTSVAFQVPKFIRWLKDELLTEAERAEIESNAHSMGLELQGKIYLTFSDEQGNIVLRDELDSKLMLEAVQATLADAVRLKDGTTV